MCYVCCFSSLSIVCSDVSIPEAHPSRESACIIQAAKEPGNGGEKGKTTSHQKIRCSVHWTYFFSVWKPCSLYCSSCLMWATSLFNLLTCSNLKRKVLHFETDTSINFLIPYYPHNQNKLNQEGDFTVLENQFSTTIVNSHNYYFIWTVLYHHPLLERYTSSS